MFEQFKKGFFKGLYKGLADCLIIFLLSVLAGAVSWLLIDIFWIPFSITYASLGLARCIAEVMLTYKETKELNRKEDI